MASTKILADYDFDLTGTATNLRAPALANDAVRLIDLQAATEALSFKKSARVSGALANVPLGAPTGTIDGIAMALDDRVLLRSQTVATENGIYLWKSAASLVRSLDANTFAELEAAVIQVEEGTDAGLGFRQTQVNGVIGTNNVAWVPTAGGTPVATTAVTGTVILATTATLQGGTGNTVATAGTLATAGFTRKFVSAPIGDGVATLILVTHLLNTKDVAVSIRTVAGDAEVFGFAAVATTVNGVTVSFNVAPTTGAYVVTVIG
jgi:hypothetical protein